MEIINYNTSHMGVMCLAFIQNTFLNNMQFVLFNRGKNDAVQKVKQII